MKKLDKNEELVLFLEKFYEICDTIEASNYTLDEFYSEFSEKTHKTLLNLLKINKKEEKLWKTQDFQ